MLGLVVSFEIGMDLEVGINSSSSRESCSSIPCSGIVLRSECCSGRWTRLEEGVSALPKHDVPRSICLKHLTMVTGGCATFVKTSCPSRCPFRIVEASFVVLERMASNSPR